MHKGRHIDFHPVTVADKPLFEYYMFSSEQQNCDLNFANIFCWAEAYHTEVAEVEGFLVVRFVIDGAKCYMQPVGEGDRAAIVELLREDAFVQRVPLRLYGLSASWCTFLAERYPSEFAFDTPRALADYIYRTEDLAQLSGRKYQPKRNHLNRFVARYDWRVERLGRDNIADCVALHRKWLEAREVGEMELAEQRSVERAFEYFEELELRGLVLYADGAAVAFSYGTPISHTTFCTHIEKHDSTIEGAATMINREMARMLEGEFEFINREDDLGLEGLRFAKLSYHPTTLLAKTTVQHLTIEQRQMREMWHAIFGDEYAEIDRFLVRHSEAVPLIHKDGDRVVSMLYIVPMRMWGRRVAYIYAVATHPDYRGQGIASKLLGEALRLLDASRRFDVVALIPSSTDSKRLYERVGFEDRQWPMEFEVDDYLGTGSVPHDRAMVRECAGVAAER